MKRQLSYDFHLHSCLSPCGDEDMTPNNLVNMAALCGLSAIALTDHNSCKNCPAAAAVAKDAGLIFLPGMELSTAEEIHVVCLLPNLEEAAAFDQLVHEHLPPFENREDIFGQQLILDERDQLLGKEPYLLVNATDFSLMEVPELVKGFGGVCFPAHIDKSSYSVLSALGSIPPECGFTAFEVADWTKLERLQEEHPLLKERLILKDSDAHYLTQINEVGEQNLLETDRADVDGILQVLRGGAVLSS